MYESTTYADTVFEDEYSERVKGFSSIAVTIIKNEKKELKILKISDH